MLHSFHFLSRRRQLPRERANRHHRLRRSVRPRCDRGLEYEVLNNSIVPSGSDPISLYQPAEHAASTGPALATGDTTILLQYARLLLKWKWLIVATAVIITTLGAVFTLRMPKRYEAVGRIAFNKETNLNLGLKESFPSGSSLDDFDYNVALETQVKILQSDLLALEVIRSIKLDSDPAFTGPQGSTAAKSDGLSIDSPLQNRLIGRFRSGLKVSVVPRTRIIEIRYIDTDPKLAAKIVNGLANTYIQQNMKNRYESVMQTSDWLAKQLTDLQLKVETSQANLVRYQKEHGILGLDDKRNIVTAKLDELNRELTAATADRMKKEADYRTFRDGQADTDANADFAATLRTLRAKENDLKLQYAQASVRLGPNHPTVVTLTNSIKQVQASIQAENQRVVNGLKAQYQAAQQRESLLRSALESQKQQANQLNENSIEYDSLKREADSNRDLYQGLLQKMKEASVAAGLKSSNVWIVDMARTPGAPVSPNVPRNILLSAVLGLGFGFGLAFLLESTDQTVRTPEQAEWASMLPTLAVIPFAKAMDQPGAATLNRKRLVQSVTAKPNVTEQLVAHSRPRSQVSEAYRSLRTSLMLSGVGGPPKIIVVTSPLPQEGKTTTSVNVGVVFAQAGARVLLVDADMRRPSLHRILRLRNDRGLSTVLSSSVAATENIVRSEVPNLSVMTAGPKAPHPAELLCSPRFQQCLAQWREQYDHVVIDTPPALSVTDAVLLATHADSIVIVVRSGKTARTALRRTRELLSSASTRPVGVVVNAVDLLSVEYSYYYGYDTKYYGRYYDEGSRP